MTDIWKFILMEFKNTEIKWQINNKDKIIKAFDDMTKSGYTPEMWKSYINGIVIFPEFIDSVMEYLK